MDALEQFKEKKNGKNAKNGTVNGDEQKESNENTIDAVICCGDYNCELNGNKCTETTVAKGYKSTFHELNSNLFAAEVKEEDQTESLDPVLEKYIKMKRLKVPEQPIRSTMEQDGISQEV